MLWSLYNVLFAVGYLLLAPRFLGRMARRGGYRRGFLQRFGLYSPGTVRCLQQRHRVWIHAVSVGEVNVALRLMRELRQAAPSIAFLLSTTTSTGHAMALKSMQSEDALLYFPCDFPWVVRRALRIIRPSGLLLVEGELWPNLIREAVRRNVPVALVNGRISESSYRGYRRVRILASPVLKSMDLLLVQTSTDARRLIELGARPETVDVMGTVKYDVTDGELMGQERAAQALRACGIEGGSLVLVGGSTWPGEEAMLLEAFARLKKTFALLKLILVPRHAERAEEVQAEIRASGFPWVRRSALDATAGPAASPADVLLVDTTGELLNFYQCATVVFVGKSLTAHGGQNIIEPAALGKPVVTGPNLENFADVAADFLAADALVQVRDAAEALQAFERLLGDHALCKAYGERARQVVASKRGAIRHSAERLAAVLAGGPASRT